MSSDRPLDLAIELQAQYRLATIPILAGTKRPAIRWKEFQHAGPSAAQLPGLFNREGVTVGVLCGEPSDRLLVLDCDNPESLDRAVTDLGNPATPIIQTARGGHIYLRTPVPVKSTRGEGMDIRGQREYVLAPGAIHPTGVRYAWISRTDRIHELAGLDIWPGMQLQPAPLRPDGLPRRAWQLLTGEHIADYSTRSEGEAAIVGSLIRAGYTFDGILAIFHRHAHLRSKFRELEREDPANAIRWLQLTFDHVRAHLAQHETEAHRLARELKELARSATWAGRTGATDRAVFLAHLEIMQRCGKPEYHASARDLGEIAGVSFQTAINANRRLQKANMLELAETAVAGLAHIWRPAQDPACFVLGHSSHPICDGVSNYETLPHDVFRWSGLGKSAAQIWALLQHGRASSAGEIARVTGRGRATVWRALKRMHRLAMVAPAELADGGVLWAVVPNVDLDQIAREIGTAGLSKRQKERHAHDRAAHRRALEMGGRK